MSQAFQLAEFRRPLFPVLIHATASCGPHAETLSPSAVLALCDDTLDTWLASCLDAELCSACVDTRLGFHRELVSQMVLCIGIRVVESGRYSAVFELAVFREEEDRPAVSARVARVFSRRGDGRPADISAQAGAWVAARRAA